MREKVIISAIGSCRISTPFKRAPQNYPVVNNTNRIFGYTHTSSEALQQIRFLQDDINLQDEFAPILMPNIDKKSLTENRHSPSDIYFIELSSAKSLSIAGTQVQLNYFTQYFKHLFKNKDFASQYWRLARQGSYADKLDLLNTQGVFHQLNDTDKLLLTDLSVELATPNTIQRDMQEIVDRVRNVVFVTHCNANTLDGQQIASRSKYIDMVEYAASKMKLPAFNPTISMQVFGQNNALTDAENSLAHYSEEFGDFLFDGLFEHYIAPLQGTTSMSSSKALSQAITSFSNRKVPTSISPHIGGVCMITGSLGAGGAERQLTRLAVEMKKREQFIDNDMPCIAGEVEVIVSTLSGNRQRDFFLPTLREADVPVSVIDGLSTNLDIADLPFAIEQVFRFLPTKAQNAVKKLTTHLASTRPEVAYIWQDGAVLTTVLAALAAHVPHIVISLRGMPPNLRPEIMRDEYFDMYRALAKVPSVTFSANSHASAKAYAKWLEMPEQTIATVHNAADALPFNGDSVDISLWEEFSEKTKDADFTFGGVFRFDQNKRPKVWLDFAAAALDAYPNSPFVLVGDGAELEASKLHAKKLGIDHRCLFVGKSRNVGFWLARMDALGLTSRLEGLPNVLIEAQHAGLPVISTPAGGAEETFINNKTGFLLSSTHHPSVEQFVSFFGALAQNPEQRKQMAREAKLFARASFAIERILPETLSLLHNGNQQNRAQKKAMQL